MAFDVARLFEDVFGPQKGEKVTVMTDRPHGSMPDNPKWVDRRKMAEEWRAAYAKNAGKWGIDVNPLVIYDATGSHGADLPEKMFMDGNDIGKEELFDNTNIIISFSQFSATGPLVLATKKRKSLRGASMPILERRMERTGLSADYGKIAEVCAKLGPMLESSVSGDVEFSTGHKCHFDLRYNHIVIDDANLHPASITENSNAICNLPAGEVFKCPYEGWKEGEESKTKGEIPAKYGDELVVYVVDKNFVVDIKGDGPEAKRWREYFDKDSARRNIAEFAIGVNDKAVVTGNVLEDEKAGFHWAYGTNSHIGGKWGPDKFKAPENVIHQDIVYAPASPIVAKKVDLSFSDGTRKTVMVDGKLVI